MVELQLACHKPERKYMNLQEIPVDAVSVCASACPDTDASPEELQRCRLGPERGLL